MKDGEMMINLSVTMLTGGSIIVGALAFFIKRLIADIDEIKKEMQKTYKDVAVLRAEVVKRNGFDQKLEKFSDKIESEISDSLKECREIRIDCYEKIEDLSRQIAGLRTK